MSSAWLVFKRLRAAFFALSAILCMGSTVIYSILLFREWVFYDVAQKSIVISLISINGFSSIILYLMIVVRFQFWLDAARVGFLLVFQLGGTVVFIVFQSGLPCQNLGSSKDCQQVVSGVTLLGWVLSGMLLLYTFLLLYSRSLSPVTGPPDPEARLLRDDISYNRNSYTSIDSKSSLIQPREMEENKQYMQHPYIVHKNPVSPSLTPLSNPSQFTPRPPMASRNIAIDSRTISPASFRSNGHTFYDPHSPAFSQSSNAVNPPSHRIVGRPENNGQLRNGSPAMEPSSLPNPFLTQDPISRQGTSFSVHTYSSSHSDASAYSPSLLPVLAVPVSSYQERVHSPNGSLHLQAGVPKGNSTNSQPDSTPLALRPSLDRYTNRGPTQYSPSNRNGYAQVGVLSTRRSNTYPYDSLTAPPASYSTRTVNNSEWYPPLPLAAYPPAYRVQELRRYGSDPNMSWNHSSNS